MNFKKQNSHHDSRCRAIEGLLMRLISSRIKISIENRQTGGCHGFKNGFSILDTIGDVK